MNGYVEIKFENSRNNNTYFYMVPDFISLHEIEGWVIVEDKFWYKGCGKSPYKIVKVINVYDKTYTPDFPNFTPYAYIADVVHGKRFKELRETQKRIEFIDDKMVEKFAELPVLTKINLMRMLTNTPSEECELSANENFVLKNKEIF